MLITFNFMLINFNAIAYLNNMYYLCTIKVKQLITFKTMATNRKIYQVEVRQFFKSNNGFDTLNACSPFVLNAFSSKKKVMEHYEKTLKALNLIDTKHIQYNEDLSNNILCGIAQHEYVDNMRYVVLVKQYIVI